MHTLLILFAKFCITNFVYKTIKLIFIHPHKLTDKKHTQTKKKQIIFLQILLNIVQ